MKDDEQLSGRVLGEDGGPVPVEGVSGNRDAVLDLVTQARHFVYIYTRDLDPPLYDDPAVERALAKLAREGRQSHIRIIVQDSSRAVQRGHRLITLAQRLSSYVQIRNPSPDYMDYNEAFLVADNKGLLRRKIADRHEGFVDFNDRLAARELVRYFQEVWEHGRPDPQLRLLHL